MMSFPAHTKKITLDDFRFKHPDENISGEILAVSVKETMRDRFIKNVVDFLKHRECEAFMQEEENKKIINAFFVEQ
jgi:hypothetical protein